MPSTAVTSQLFGDPWRPVPAAFAAASLAHQRRVIQVSGSSPLGRGQSLLGGGEDGGHEGGGAGLDELDVDPDRAARVERGHADPVGVGQRDREPVGDAVR